MDRKGWVGAFSAAIGVQLVIFILSLPGFGIETRKPSDYAAWAGPIFLALTLLVFLLGIVALLLLRSRLMPAAALGAGQAFVALATNLLDISHVGGPPPPSGPLVLGVLSMIVALATLAIAYKLRAWIPPTASMAGPT